MGAVEQAVDSRALQPFLCSMQMLSQNELSLLSGDLRAVQTGIRYCSSATSVRLIRLHQSGH